jgi:alkylhydroperoxidase family enzyme
MRLSKPRVDPLGPEDWSDEQKELMSRFDRPESPSAPNIFRTLVHHPDLMKRWLVFGNHILGKSTLPPRERELLILRVGWLCRAGYEWGQHVVIGKQTGLSDEEIARIPKGPDAPGWDSFDATLLRAADELHGDAFLSDATWQALGERYDTKQLMDLVFTVGQYNLVSMALNTLGVQLDAGIEGLPE